MRIVGNSRCDLSDLLCPDEPMLRHWHIPPEMTPVCRRLPGPGAFDFHPRVMVGGPGCPTVVAELGACPGQGAAKHRKQQEKEMTTVA